MIQLESIAGYRIQRVLGQGGMGRVYEALQTEPVRRRVALKVLRPGGSGDDVAARFSAEQQALALMNHPGIAKVFDAGVTEDGRQWFAMELVAGEELTEYADRARLDIAARVELFARVCQAVQHAHLKGVIHRDLKPSNVLVAEGDTGPAPKVIDFGVAKAVDLRLSEETLVTQFGAVIGTPAYMSPEQAGGTTLDIDTRSDVYSLGVMLYELLVGCLPVDPTETGYPSFIAYLKQPDTTPPTPSDRFTTLDAEVQRSAASDRETSPSRLREQLAGDLGWIVMTALEKERGRRYESAGSLGRDLERYLRREPVAARPPSRAYQLRKFVSRNRVAVAAAAAVVAALAVGVTAATIGMVRAQREAVIAQREARTSERVSWFMASIFSAADPEQSRGRDVTVREVLDRSVPQIEAELADEPVVQARLMRAIGQAYQGLGLFGEARPILERSLELLELNGGNPADIAALQHDLGYLLTFLSEFQVADSLLRASLDHHVAAEGHGTDWTTVIVSNLAFNALRSGRGIAAADSLLAATRSARIARLGADHHRVATAAYLRCWTLRELGHRMAADSACAASLDLVKRSMGDDAPVAVYNTSAIGHTRLALGRWAEAREAYEAAIAINRRLHDGGHPETAYALAGIAAAYLGEGRPDTALGYARQAVDMLYESLGPTSTELTRGQETLAMTLVGLRRFKEAEAVFDSILAIDSVNTGVSSQRYATHLGALGEARMLWGDSEAAFAIQQRALTLMEAAVPAESPRLIVARTRAGKAARRTGELGVAESLLRDALATTDASPADFPLERADIQTELALTLVERGKGVGRDADACRYAADSRAALAERLGGGHWRTAWSEAVSGLCLMRFGDVEEGELALRAGLDGLEATRPPEDVHRADATRWLETGRVRVTGKDRPGLE